MSRFFSEKYADLEPYVPGEQPQDQEYIKLNTNENPFPPHPAVVEAVQNESRRLHLYSDPECRDLRRALAKRTGLREEQLIMTNGSDEILNFAFMAFCDRHTPAVFADITYGFYPVFAQINGVPYREIPLKEDLRLEPKAFYQTAGTVCIANPNAPTGYALTREEIQGILEENSYNAVIIDEAYVDFGAESAIPLIREYDNLLVVQTFSKSRSLAGGRLGFGAGNPELIRDLEAVRYSINPYNVNRMTSAAGIASLEHDDYYMKNSKIIQENRRWAGQALKKLGFEMTDSMANFLFVRHPKADGETLYREAKKRGVLIRHFNQERIRDYNRITVGTREQMEQLVRVMEEILGGMA